MRPDFGDGRPVASSMRHWIGVAIVALVTVTGCGGGGDDGGGPAGPGLSISSGNNQTVEQHLRGKFTVRVLDASSHSVSGTVVTFSAPGLTTDPLLSTATSGSDGIATFYGSFHTTGNVQVTASASGFAPVTFHITVTQNPYKFDGYYDCVNRGTNGGADKYYLRVEGTLVTTDNDLAALREVNFDPVGGSLSAKQRQGLDIVGHWSGVFAVDSASVATLTGTDEPWWRDSYPNPGSTPSPLACTRQ